ncbi:hypothetical protein PENTCL1PPCAC_14894 [Pristionchus entomophagus]|uniref:USP domain-containing protein n=1 Tax=Pristionchus entomophagus TaxID=358040 RepID=A0AAV5TBP8_9BILA|nr:hypothetical protein PENTCL1PPCAC_14894 [Pristionchus entomophagus]
MDFIKAHFAKNGDGEFNLEGDEIAMILDKAKKAIEYSLSTRCQTCGKEAKSRKNYLYVSSDCEKRLPSAMLHAALTRMGKNHRCPSTCEKSNHFMELEMDDTTWMLPIDLSPIRPKASLIGDLPVMFEVGDVSFRLTGISLFADAHYTAVLRDGKDWLYYDGIAEPPLKVYTDIKKLKVDPSTNIKVAYYLRVRPNDEPSDIDAQ